jgi:Phosphotransferase enzyme family
MGPRPLRAGRPQVSRRPEWAVQVARAAPIIRQARAAGWPTPAWLAVGTTSQGWPYEVQEWVDGSAMDHLGVEQAEMILGLLDTQAGIAPRGPQNWSAYNYEVVFDDRAGIAGQLRASSVEGAEIVASFGGLCDRYRSCELRVADLVHGDLSTENILVRAGQVVGVIDAEAAEPTIKIHPVSGDSALRIQSG